MITDPVKCTLFTLLLLLSTTIAGPVSAEGDKDVVRLGVLAKRGHDKAIAKWQPTIDYLAARIPHRRFELIALEFDEIPPVVRNALIDFLIVNPAIYADLSARYGLRRILTLENRLTNKETANTFGSVLFTRAGNQKINRWSDLPGNRIAAVHKTSLGGWIIILYEMTKRGIDTDAFEKIIFSGTHDQVVRDVLSGTADVGVVRTDTLERMAHEGRLDLNAIKVIEPAREVDFPLRLSSRLVPEWPISELRHVSSELAGEVAVALLEMSEEDQAARAAHIKGWTIPQNYQSVRDILKTLNLPPYNVPPEIQLWSVIEQYRYWIIVVVVILLIQSALIARVFHLNHNLKRQQRIARQNEEQFRSLFQQASVGFAFTTPTGGLRQANRSLLELTGRSEVELRRLNITDLLSAEALSSANAYFEAMRRGERNKFTLETRLEIRPGHKDIWVLFTLTAVRDENNDIKYLVGIFDDISHLKQLEHQLKNEQYQKSLILDIAGDGILGLDKDGTHTFVNKAAANLLGYEVDELLGQPSHDLWHHSFPDGSPFPEDECPITAVLHVGIVHRGEKEVFWRKDGTSFQVEYISTPILEDDQVTGAVVVFREQANSVKHRHMTS